MDIRDFILAGADIIGELSRIGEDVPTILAIAKKMIAVADSTTEPSQADFDELDALAAPSLADLNDKTKDV